MIDIEFSQGVVGRKAEAWIVTAKRSTLTEKGTCVFAGLSSLATFSSELQLKSIGKLTSHYTTAFWRATSRNHCALSFGVRCCGLKSSIVVEICAKKSTLSKPVWRIGFLFGSGQNAVKLAEFVGNEIGPTQRKIENSGVVRP
jgi:hypothetical protein